MRILVTAFVLFSLIVQPSSQTNLDEEKQVALLLLQSQQFDQAYDHLRTLVSSDPDDPDVLYLLGRVMAIVDSDNREALEFLGNALTHKPDNVKVLETLLNAHVRFKEWQAAESVVIRLQEVEPHKNRWVYIESVLLSEQMENERAIQKLRLAYPESPNDAEVLALMGVLSKRIGSPVVAQEYFQQALSIDPENEISNMERARYFLTSKNEAHALRHVQAVLRRNPYRVEAYNLLAQTYARLGDSEQALATMKIAEQVKQRSEGSITYYKTLLNHPNPSAENRFLLANELYRLKRMDVARALYDSIEPDSDVFDASRIPFTQLLLEVNEGDASFEAIQSIRDPNVLTEEVRYRLYVQAAIATRRIELARAACKTGLKRYPESQSLLKLQAYLNESVESQDSG